MCLQARVHLTFSSGMLKQFVCTVFYMNSSLNITIVMQSERGAMYTMHMHTGNIQCAFLRVHPRMYAYPAVLLELLSAAGTSFATPL